MPEWPAPDRDDVMQYRRCGRSGLDLPATPAAGVRLVALDVDGTVLDENLTVAPSTRSAVRDARRRGVRVVLASSRGPVALERVQAALGVRDEWFIGYQGALVARWADSGLEVLAETPLDPAAARLIEREAEARGLSVGRYAGPRWLVPRVTEAIRREALTTDERPLPSTPEERDAAPPPHKLLVIADGDGQLAALDDLARSLPPTVTGTFSHPRYLEVTAAGVDKAHGLRPLARELGIAMAETAAVGDGANDLGLFRAVGCPIAMGQAAAEVRAAAAWVTGSIADHGVARALARLDLVGDTTRELIAGVGAAG